MSINYARIVEGSLIPRLITEVAVKDCYGRTWHLPAGFRHHHVIQLMNRGSLFHINEEEGFLTNFGEFISRQEAFVLAKQNKQYKRRDLTAGYKGNELFSEDLW